MRRLRNQRKSGAKEKRNRNTSPRNNIPEPARIAWSFKTKLLLVMVLVALIPGFVSSYIIYRDTSGTIIALSLAVAAFVGILSYFLARQISRPIMNLADATRELEKGNYDVQVDSKSRDEIGVLSKAFNQMTRPLERCSAAR